MALSGQSRTAAAKAENARLKAENKELKFEIEKLREHLLKSMGKKYGKKPAGESGMKGRKITEEAAGIAGKEDRQPESQPDDIAGRREDPGVLNQAAAEEKATAKKEPLISIHYFELEGEQISSAAMEERVIASLKAEGYNTADMKTLDIYYNFSERRAYYVADGKAEGKSLSF